MAKASQCLVIWCFLVTSALVAAAAVENVETANANESKNETDVTEISPDVFKKLMWKKCSNNSYVACAKLALAYVIEKLDFSENLILMPGISLLKRSDGSTFNLEEVIVRQDFNEALDRYLIEKIKRYLGSLTISVKLLDKNTIDDMRSLGEALGVSPNIETGRGKKKYMHSLLMAGWMSGATLLALTMKTIAILSGKAMLAALLSLMLSVISAFGKHHHGELKSTTYEIITKPIVSHSHSTDIHEAHASELSPAYGYKRSIPSDVVVNADSSSDIELLKRKIRDRGFYYAPIAVEYAKT